MSGRARPSRRSARGARRPSRRLRTLAAVCYTLAEQGRAAGRPEPAREAALRSRDLWGRLAIVASEGDREGADAGLAKSAYVLGALHDDLGHPRAALDAYREAAALYERLAGRRPGWPPYHRDLGACHHNIGRLLIDLAAPDEAIAAYRRAASLRERLAGQPDAIPGARSDLVGTLRRLGDALERAGRPSEAADAYRLAIAHQRAALAEAGPEAIDERRARLSELLAALDRAADG